MTIFVFSDSHGTDSEMINLINTQRPDGIIHLGDGLQDALNVHHIFPDIPFYNVYGNCDGVPPDQMLVKEIELEGKRILFSHGHVWKVKDDLSGALEAGLLHHADIVLFGHTHIPFANKTSQFWVMNPGPGSVTYGKIEIEEDDIHCEVFAFTGK